MIWFIGLMAALGLMKLSDKHLGNPLAFIGLGFLTLCFTLIAGVVWKTITMTLG